MPGVLVVEALAQLSTVLLRQKIGESHKNFHFLAYNVRGVQFFKPIFPRDKIILKDEILGIYDIEKNKIAHVKGQALVTRAVAKGGDEQSSSTREELKCEARFSVVIVEKEEFKKNMFYESKIHITF